MTFGQFGAIRPVDERQMRKARQVPPHRAVDHGLTEGVGQVVITANNVGDVHIMVIHHHGVLVGGRAIGAEDDHIIEFGIGDADFALHQIFNNRLALTRGFDADSIGRASGRFRWVTVTPHPVVTGRLAVCHCVFTHLFELFRRAVALVGQTFLQQFQRDFRMARLPGGLENGRFICRNAHPGQSVENNIDSLLGGPLTVGILNAQEELAAVMTGKKKVEQGRAGVADMQQAGRTRGKACADRRHGAHPYHAHTRGAICPS